MSILGGHFAVMLIVKLPDSVDRGRLDAALIEVQAELGLEATAVNEVDHIGAARPAASHVLTVYGADHPGIVHAVTSALAGKGVNITDLETRLTGSPESPLYVMMMELALDENDESDVEAELRRAGQESAVEVSLRRLEAEAL